jgi:hypothetical protein
MAVLLKLPEAVLNHEKQDRGRVSPRLCVGRLHVDFERDSASWGEALSLPPETPNGAIRMASKPAGQHHDQSYGDTCNNP